MPIAAARTTDGSGRASSTNPATPSSAHEEDPAAADADPARDEQQRGEHQREVGARHRGEVGQPGGPELLDHVAGQPLVVPGHQRRDQGAAASGPPAADRRTEARTASAARNSADGRSDHLRSRAVRRAPRPRARSEAGASRPVVPDDRPQPRRLPGRLADDQHRHRRRRSGRRGRSPRGAGRGPGRSRRTARAGSPGPS